ncbi:MAG: hypothetical protein V3U75_02785 [Methylococcaceae bacterium]
MTNVKKYLAAVMLIFTFGILQSTAWAEKAAAPAPATAAEVITHLDAAMPFLENGDVANGTTHIRMARSACKTMSHEGEGMKSVLSDLTQALIHSKKGHPGPSMEAINKAKATLESM